EFVYIELLVQNAEHLLLVLALRLFGQTGVFAVEVQSVNGQVELWSLSAEASDFSVCSTWGHVLCPPAGVVWSHTVNIFKRSNKTRT
ncbi:MAG TPA: hypothetical protein VNZ44_02970, partial [Pyrinomonadaceae bacterium]|nr:hypothetical protein [Pyrinomonadaceae bacterium]